MGVASIEIQEVSSSPKPSRALELRIINHVIDAVEVVDAAEEPYCQYYVENVLPPDVYEDMLYRLPDPEYYRPLNLKEWSRANGESTRDRLVLSKDGLADQTKKMQDFWLSIARALISEQLKRVIFAKLAKDIALRFDLPQRAWDGLEIACVHDNLLGQIRPCRSSALYQLSARDPVSRRGWRK
jgi:hypothetical protein